MEISAKSRLRITIESLLIDLNEEIFAISEEIAKSFTESSAYPLVSKAREYDVRKRNLLKRVSKTILDDPIAKVVRKEFGIKSVERASSRSKSARSKTRSRSNSREKKHFALRNINSASAHHVSHLPQNRRGSHSPP